MKTKEEILDTILEGGKMLPYTRRRMLDAMQEHTDQAIAEYKRKLKEEIDLYESTGAPLLKEVIYLMIDNPSEWYDENNNLNA